MRHALALLAASLLACTAAEAPTLPRLLVACDAGEPCQSADDCGPFAPLCVDSESRAPFVPDGERKGSCAAPCELDADCPAGICGSGNVCADEGDAAPACPGCNAGEPCAVDADCEGRGLQCVGAVEGEAKGKCVVPCDGECEAGECVTGYCRDWLGPAICAP